MMILTLTAFFAACLAPTVLMWPHPPGLAAVVVVASMLAGALSIMAVVDDRFRRGVAMAGALMILASFAYPEAGIATMALDVSVALLFVGVGLVPGKRQMMAVAAPIVVARQP